MIIVADCRNSVVRIGLDGGNYDALAQLPREWKIRKEPVMGIQANPANSNKITCWTDASIAQITLVGNKRKLGSSASESAVEVKLIDEYRPILFFAHLPNGVDSVVVERPWISIVENFPPAFYRSRYGAQ